jgi:hypothetical protein
MMAAGLILIAASLFIAGRLSAPRQTHYLIGAPINSDDKQAGAVDARLNGADQKRVSAADERMCGALTKRGRPCRRKVKGEVRCWQHRDRPSSIATANGK